MYRPHDFRVPIHFLIFRLRGGSIAGRCVEMAGGPTGLANIPLIEVGHLRGQSAGSTPGWVQHRGQRVTHGSPHRRVAKSSRRRWGGLAVNLHVLPQREWVNVGFVTTLNLTVLGCWYSRGSVSFDPCHWKTSQTSISLLNGFSSAWVHVCIHAQSPPQSRHGCSTPARHDVVHQFMHSAESFGAAGDCWPVMAAQSSHLIRTTVRMEEGPP